MTNNSLELPAARKWQEFSSLVYDHVLAVYLSTKITPDTLEAFETKVDAALIAGIVKKHLDRALEDQDPVILLRAAYFLALMREKLIKEAEKPENSEKIEEGGKDRNPLK